MTNHWPINFSEYNARLRHFILSHSSPVGRSIEADFNHLALELFKLQFDHNAPYRQFCDRRKIAPQAVKDWADIPAVPTVAFKELEMTSLPLHERARVFRSSGTTEQRPSRHFHDAESLSLYEASLSPWFAAHLLPEKSPSKVLAKRNFIALTPPPTQAPNSSLVHMFDIIRREFGSAQSGFVGQIESDDSWNLNLGKTMKALRDFIEAKAPVIILGTAFNYVHLLDYLKEQGLRLELPAGSHALETGGYKGRSRTMPKTELHELITNLLGIPPSQIICEYGMSELSSQAYDSVAGNPNSSRKFNFPPWARAQMISPESGREVGEGETGLIRIFDLANVYSVMAIQTEDLGVRRGDGFELLGRAVVSEPRGCSLQSV